ncbi:two-component sensor histidine kinase [Photobacterium jeanii]|uniref:histidine kinase n=1 Tax=Photobacterium jeanii TaxID=858640 RepID=A0A178KPC4_9GAMM|nr:ATP-binding protein [Photobacterium jeanii]OAN18775.1 two-component sensor histidine kinase [Photobacterium jeanii]PST92818.1 sensor histidine kinase [Photobacterium jeanii]
MSKSIRNSLIFRFSFALLVVITAAELVAGAIWFYASKVDKQDTAKDTMVSLSGSVVETFEYFQSLPVNYRHLILGQLREAGATRFFISINSNPLEIDNLAKITFADWLTDYTHDLLQEELDNVGDIRVSITNRDEIKLFNSGIKLNELPQIWTRYGLALSELDLPIVVIQIEMQPDEWFYIASVLPLSFSALTTQFIDMRQVIFLIIATALLMLCTTRLLQREFRPIKKLAKSATLMGSTLSLMEIKEEGSNETRAAIHAFNKMNRRIQAYMADRDMLFSAISHDLKTPLACLKFRTEMLDDDKTRLKFEKLLNDMDAMLHGALQCIRDTDAHEPLEQINISRLLADIADDYNFDAAINSPRVEIIGEKDVLYLGKPVAIKRCLHNLIDNGVRYGNKVAVTIDTSTSESALVVIIRDFGEGLTQQQIDRVFEPYYRADRKDQSGSGLGLTISRSIARSHGGDLLLRNHAEQGLEVQVILSRET